MKIILGGFIFLFFTTLTALAITPEEIEEYITTDPIVTIYTDHEGIKINIHKYEKILGGKND